ncbi:MAG: cytochrome P450 [Hyphomicrobium sp.]|uniref:cytochrome P450 n=1 Tax=Hyphomicrobium sp. TaxID=82 RepID=UPI001326B556|nr:cytochrome P450 [Hyphomicrobium sp.]KAB2942310.1 MAG: cytochrome P450 [Hyphomicrobium sp.]MBZ0209247.1 cytochrome P450 [Hyphomicrobium sp.]
MAAIPRDASIDSTLAMLRDTYRFISKRCQFYGSDLFETRIMLRKTIYQPTLFMRGGIMPGRIEKTLFGRGGVQGLDDAAHRHRKKMLLSVMTPAQVEQLIETASREWHIAARKWASMGEVVLYDALQELLTRAACTWAGVPPREEETRLRTRQITALFDDAATLGPRHWWARLARKFAERWMSRIVAQIQTGDLTPPPTSAAHIIAGHQDLTGGFLSHRIAAVELLNVVRPTVAVAVYITFVAHALQSHPECRQKLRSGEKGYAELFAQEVRRFYPFFPFVMARARHDFDWKGYKFSRGTRVLLDLYGTNHDTRTWRAPEKFDPDRFRKWDPSLYNFIPQGGGDPAVNHRCPGERNCPN